MLRRLQLLMGRLLLSDPTFLLAEALRLPTFTAQAIPRSHGGTQRLYRRLTLVLDGTRIEHVFYPVFPPDTDATQVVEWLQQHPKAASSSGPADPAGAGDERA